MSCIKGLVNRSARLANMPSLSTLIALANTASQQLTELYPWLTAHHLGFSPKTHQPGGLGDGDKPGAQLVGFEQATTINTLKMCQYNQ